MELKSEEELIQRRLEVAELQNKVSQFELRLREKQAVRDLISGETWTQEELNLSNTGS